MWIIERFTAGQWIAINTRYTSEKQALAYLKGLKRQDPDGVYQVRFVV